MRKVFIIHGFEGSPNGGWRPWLMGELEKKEVYACALAMPNPAKPVPAEWVKEIARHVEVNKQDQIYLVGHSLGVPAILHYMQRTKSKIAGLVLVSGPILVPKKKKIVAFVTKAFDYKKIKSKVKKITVIHGDNDDRVPVDEGKYLAKELNAKLVIVKNGGHLNGSSGWLQLPQALEVLNEMFV